MNKRMVIAVLLSLALLFQGAAMSTGAHMHDAGVPAHGQHVDHADTHCHGSPDDTDGTCAVCASCAPGLTHSLVSPVPSAGMAYYSVASRSLSFSNNPQGPPPKTA